MAVEDGYRIERKALALRHGDMSENWKTLALYS
jgi:hypothetical protein